MSATSVALGVPTATAAAHSHQAATVSHAATSHHSSRAKELAKAQHSLRSKPAGKVAKTSKVRFNLVFSLAHPVLAKEFVTSVSTPGSSNFHHYLTLKKFNKKYGATTKSIVSARNWLRKKGFKVGALPKTRLILPASGSAARVEKYFHTSLGYYKVNGHKVRLTRSPLEVPSAIHGQVSAITGVSQTIDTTSLTRASASTARPATKEPPPDPGFRNPPQCSTYWDQLADSKDAASLITPYTDRHYDICGYTPSQLRSAYNVAPAVAKGDDGKGVTVAIVDAYDSPTLFKDAVTYDKKNDASHVITSKQFTDVNPGGNITDLDACDAGGWYGEQSLDVESSHGIAPGANIEYVGASSCFDSDLIAAEQTAISSGASVVSNSYGDTAGDLLDDADSKTAWDDTFTVADATGVSVLFSSGDAGDNFAETGIDAPDYPVESPYVTAVGGTSLEIGSTGARTADLGWSTGKQILCAPVMVTNCGKATAPSLPMAYNSGGGGGTSINYPQPAYQAGVVPDTIAQRNSAIDGPFDMRVIPDVSMDGDAQTGMLVGQSQTFPTGVYYDQYKVGGTSLASPLFAGLVADTDQAAGSSLGFLNPLLYKADSEYPDAFDDIVPPTNANAADTIRVDYVNEINPSNGYAISLRVLDYEGPETYCDNTGNCATRPVTLSTAKGYDDMTGLGSAGNNFIAELSKF